MKYRMIAIALAISGFGGGALAQQVDDRTANSTPKAIIKKNKCDSECQRIKKEDRSAKRKEAAELISDTGKCVWKKKIGAYACLGGALVKPKKAE